MGAGGLGVVVVGGVALRLALPSIVKSYVNRKLDENPTYRGQVGDIDVALYRGAYTLHGMEVRKRTGLVPEPLFEADRVDLAIGARRRRRTGATSSARSKGLADAQTLRLYQGVQTGSHVVP